MGNAYYEVNLLEKQILRSKAKPRVKSTGKKVSEEDTCKIEDTHQILELTDLL